jgi:membrane protein required for colicin V production
VTVFDFVVIAVIVLSAVFAYSRGFVREALSIAAWLLAGAAAYYAFPFAAPLFERFLPRGMVANVAAASVVFVVALVILHVIAKALAGRVKHSPLSPVDRTLGLLFGLARGLVLVCIGYIPLAWVPPADQPHWFTESRTLPFLAAGAEKLQSLIPRAARPATPGRSGRAVENDAEKAMRAFTNPAPPAAAPVNAPPAYSPGEQRDLNRLIEQQNGP